MNPTLLFSQAREFLLKHRTDYQTAYLGFQWPEFEYLNWATDWFDFFASKNPARIALWILQADGSELLVSYEQLARQSSFFAAFLTNAGLKKGDRILIMLPNCVQLWEAMLGAMKAGVVVVPCSTLLTAQELKDRMIRAEVKLVVTDLAGSSKVDPGIQKLIVGEDYAERVLPADFRPQEKTRPSDPCLFYFTSGTTSKHKTCGPYSSKLSRRASLDNVLVRNSRRGYSL